MTDPMTTRWRAQTVVREWAAKTGVGRADPLGAAGALETYELEWLIDAIAASYAAGRAQGQADHAVPDATWAAAEALIERWRGLSDADATAELLEDRAQHVRAGRVAMREEAVKIASDGEYDWCENDEGNMQPCINATHMLERLRALPDVPAPGEGTSRED